MIAYGTLALANANMTDNLAAGIGMSLPEIEDLNAGIMAVRFSSAEHGNMTDTP